MRLPGQDPPRKALKLQEAGIKNLRGFAGCGHYLFFLPSQTMVVFLLKEQNFETPPAAADNSSGVTRVAKKNKTWHPGLNHFQWIT